MKRTGTISTRITPWSSIVGQSVQLLAEDGRCVAQLSVHVHAEAAGDQDIKKCARAVAKWVEEAFDALAEKNAVIDTLGYEGLER
jgi:hypothetical protein